MKQFIKALDKSEKCFDYICFAFSGLSVKKKKIGVLDGPQIRQLLRDTSFVSLINHTEARTWMAFTNVIKNFLGNEKADNYKKLAAELLSSFQYLGCNMSIRFTTLIVTWILF